MTSSVHLLLVYSGQLFHSGLEGKISRPHLYTFIFILQVTPTKLNKKGEEIENEFQCSYGGLKVNDLIGKRYGTRIQLSKVSLLN